MDAAQALPGAHPIRVVRFQRSASSRVTRTCETQPVTLLSSVWSSAAIGCSLAAKNSSCLYLALGSGTW